MIAMILLLLVIKCTKSRFIINTTTIDGTYTNNASNNIPTATSLPNATQIYTTSTSDDCDYYSNSIDALFPSHTTFDSIIARNNTMEITFDLKLNHYCNASSCNICIKSSPVEERDNGSCPQCIGEIKCGQSISGELFDYSSFTTNPEISTQYYFNLSKPASVLFDSCGSAIDTYLYLYNTHGDVLFQGDDESYCVQKNVEQLATPALDAGDYILGIGGHFRGAWYVKALCYYEDELDDDPYWTAISCCGDISIDSDAIFASWNDLLFVVDEYKIYYSTFRLFDTNYVWTYVGYNTLGITWDLPPYYAQYQSSIYIYIYKNVENDILIHINLMDLSDVVFVPNNSSWTGEYADKFCIVANSENVYVVRTAVVMIYNLNNPAWRVVDIPSRSNVIFGCTMDKDYRIIYVVTKDFGPITFDTVSEKPGIILLQGVVRGDVWSMRSSIIAGWNNKIYLHRCVLLQCDELIVSLPANTSLPTAYVGGTVTVEFSNIISAASQLMLFDDNIILLQSRNYRDAISLHYRATNMISINFTGTISSELVWPSDGFTIKYYLNDFSNSSSDFDVYRIWFQSIDINASITLNVSNDKCIRYAYDYNYRNCSLHFELERYLLPTHNLIDDIDFYPIGDNETDMLILPQTILIQLQRCVITINISETKRTHIAFNFSLSSNCHYDSKIGHNFSFHITSNSSSLDITKELTIEIVSDTTKLCRLCEINTHYDCADCDGEHNTFIIYRTINSDERFEIALQSSMVDLRVIPPLLSDKISYSKISYSNNQFLYLLFINALYWMSTFIPFFECPHTTYA
eukprot:368083_1